LTPRSAGRLSPSDRGLLPGLRAPTRAGLAPAGLIQLSGRTMAAEYDAGHRRAADTGRAVGAPRTRHRGSGGRGPDFAHAGRAAAASIGWALQALKHPSRRPRAPACRPPARACRRGQPLHACQPAQARRRPPPGLRRPPPGPARPGLRSASAPHSHAATAGRAGLPAGAAGQGRAPCGRGRAGPGSLRARPGRAGLRETAGAGRAPCGRGQAIQHAASLAPSRPTSLRASRSLTQGGEVAYSR
jgi:hypothetical protein